MNYGADKRFPKKLYVILVEDLTGELEYIAWEDINQFDVPNGKHVGIYELVQVGEKQVQHYLENVRDA